MASESAPSASVRIRVFFALWPDAPARAALARLAQEVARDGHGRAPRAANLHLTLAFIGEVPKARLDALADIGPQAAAGASPFQLALERIGGTAYGIAWLAPQSLPEPLHALHVSVSDAVAAAGFELRQRMFRPHVTLARDCTRPAHRGRVSPIMWQVEDLALVASTLAAGGSHYRSLGRWPLSTRPGNSS